MPPSLVSVLMFFSFWFMMTMEALPPMWTLVQVIQLVVKTIKLIRFWHRQGAHLGLARKHRSVEVKLPPPKPPLNRLAAF